MSEQVKVKGYGLAMLLLWVGSLGLGLQPDLAAQAPPSNVTQQTATLQEAQRLEDQVIQLYRAGKYQEAIPLAKRSLQLRKTAPVQDHSLVADSLSNLALLYHAQGLYAEAEPFYMQSLEIYERALGKDHLSMANCLNNLAAMYHAQGLYAKAEPLFLRSLSIRESALPKDVAAISNSLNNLAAMYSDQGLYAKAEPLYLRSLDLRERALPKDLRAVATSLNNLAELYYVQGLYGKAEPFYVRSLDLLERALPKDLPAIATSLNNLAALYDAQGLYGKAEPFYVRSLNILERTLGAYHPNVAGSLNNLAVLYYAQGNLPLAAQFLERGLNIEETNLSLTLTLGSEQRKQTYIGTFTGTTNGTVAIAIESKSGLPLLDRLALTTVLRRKGRILDIISANIQTLLGQQADNPEAQELFKKLRGVFQQQSALIYRGLDNLTPEQYKAEFNRLEQERDRLESSISRISSKFSPEIKPAELTAIQQQIPQDAALVEILQYRPLDLKAKQSDRYGKPRYAAYVLTTTGEPKGIDLGEAAQIEPAIELFHQAIQDLSTPLEQVKQSGHDLERLVIQPIRKLIGSKRKILISPDGELNRIPFEAIVNAQGQYLIEEFDFSYLTSGRDLLKFSNAASRQSALIIGDINYNQTQITTLQRDRTPPVQAKTTQRSRSFTNQTFTSLAGTKAEAEAIAQLLPNAQLLSDRAATETALKQVNAPNILHLATHAFFQPDPDITVSSSLTSDLKQKRDSATLKLDNPLLRSGLALAGANVRGDRSDLDDGILTAQELTTLNLHGTQLVVLSACDTGVGNVRIGEGVYGLRRALVIAGSQTQIISLWKVDDSATQRLMTQYYQNLKAGQGRHAALKAAQLALLKDPATQHPSYWAAFLPSGNWAPLKFNDAR